MAAVVVGIDVSKDHLDVHVRPGGTSFRVKRDGAGLQELLVQLEPLGPSVVALEATGGFETVVAASERNSRTCRENRILHEERDILKRATAFFARETR